MTGITYFYEDFYGCTASIAKRPNGMCLLTMRLPGGDLYCQKTYRNLRGARVALGRMTEGTARPTGSKEWKE